MVDTLEVFTLPLLHTFLGHVFTVPEVLANLQNIRLHIHQPIMRKYRTKQINIPTEQTGRWPAELPYQREK